MNGRADYYVIVRAAGATLIGIQFIVVTLLATVRSHQTSAESLGAFATPTVVHLAGALVIAALMTAPWPTLAARAVAIGLPAAAAFVYAVVVRHRAKRQSTYEPTREDWIWYVLLPSCIHAAVVIAALLLAFRTTLAAFIIAAGGLGLLLVGIHNAWDTVTYLVLGAASENEHSASDSNARV